MVKAIVVTGSVCSGKTTVAKKIAKKYKYNYIDVNKLIKDKKLYDGYDKELDSYIVDEDKLVRFLKKLVDESKKKLVIDSHMGHYLPKKYVEVCIVTKCDLKELKKRLKKRKYKPNKIRQNLDAEIFDTCLVEAKEAGHQVRVIDTTGGVKEVIL
ncbi:MAG: AAA family ATPase [Candidatus Nanoarchaeia archaeon]|nr:AAA family ATPase [Candidatus Nanoarchaeia archaeon]